MHTIRLGIARRDHDSSDESSDMVDVSSSENSASSDNESEDDLASQKTSCDGGETKKPAKRNAATTTKTSQPRKKSKVSNLLHCSRFTRLGFLQEEAVLKIDLLGKGLIQGINGDIGSPWWAPDLGEKKKFRFPLFLRHLKDFQTYQQGRVWQYSLVPVIDQMLYQAEHGWWSSGDSSLALLVHVLSLAPCLLPSILLGLHQDQVLVHFPEIEYVKNSGYLKLQQIYTYVGNIALHDVKHSIKVRKLIWSKHVHRSVADHFEKLFQQFIGNHSLTDAEILQKRGEVENGPSLAWKRMWWTEGWTFLASISCWDRWEQILCTRTLATLKTTQVLTTQEQTKHTYKLEKIPVKDVVINISLTVKQIAEKLTQIRVVWLVIKA